MIPKEQQQQAVQLQLILKNIEQSVVIEMNKGITQNSIDQMMISIEQKFATILTHSEQKITNVLTAVSENKKDDLILHSKLDQMLTKLGKNNEKGKVSENLLYGNLQNIYPTAEIRNMSQTPHAGDFWILRKDKPTILVENKNHDGTVYTGGVQKFIDNMNTQDLCGIMISQMSNIVYRENYEIEIHNGNVAVYIHEGNYDPLKIKIAVQIIDTFKNKIEKNKLENGESFNIDKQALQKINMEFQRFNNKKIQHIAEIKTMYELLTRSAEEMEMDALGDLLEAQGMSTNVKKFNLIAPGRSQPKRDLTHTKEFVPTPKKYYIVNIANLWLKQKRGSKRTALKYTRYQITIRKRRKIKLTQLIINFIKKITFNEMFDKLFFFFFYRLFFIKSIIYFRFFFYFFLGIFIFYFIRYFSLFFTFIRRFVEKPIVSREFYDK